jgi:hypothetical protein
MALSASKKSEGSEYSTTTVESHADGWTAKISRTGVSPSGNSETVSGLVNVGSISHLIATIAPLTTGEK